MTSSEVPCWQERFQENPPGTVPDCRTLWILFDDVFVVIKLNRLASSVVDLANIVQKLEGKKWSEYGEGDIGSGTVYNFDPKF